MGSCLIERRSIVGWLTKNRQHFRDQYARAADDRADAMFEDMLEIADTPVTAEKVTTKPDGKREVTTGDAVERSKLRVDARKWALARMAPKKYGDKQFLDVVKRDIPKLADDATYRGAGRGHGGPSRAGLMVHWPPDFHAENLRRFRMMERARGNLELQGKVLAYYKHHPIEWMKDWCVAF